jgi:hypothetical protein
MPVRLACAKIMRRLTGLDWQREVVWALDAQDLLPSASASRPAEGPLRDDGQWASAIPERDFAASYRSLPPKIPAPQYLKNRLRRWSKGRIYTEPATPDPE